MRILIVPDSPDWAIGHLVQSIVKINKHHKIQVISVHPRDAADKTVQKAFLREVEKFNPDLIDFEYCRTAGQLIEAIPELRRYKKILMHHNMRNKSLYQWDWQNNLNITDKIHLKIDRVLCHCNKTKELLETAGVAKNVGIIRYGFDHEYWTYSAEEPVEITLGYAGRIVSWKGLKEVAEVATELNLPVEVMGKVDDHTYWESVQKDNLRFNYIECPDEERVNFYRGITIFIQNSIDGYEEGTMPMLEAMACGVPVITTPAGQAGLEEGIFKDHENCLMVPFGDKEALKIAIQELTLDKELRDKIRKKGWDTVRNMAEEKMAREYSKIWNEIIYPDHQLASVIIVTTYNRETQLKEILDAYKFQTYPNFEVIVAYDELEKKSLINKDDYEFPIKEVWTEMDKEKHPYNLAMARNMAIIESEGTILIFNDSRLKPDESAVLMFVEAIKNASSLTMGGNKRAWFFGDKGSNKTSFVENFSAVEKDYLVKLGLFNERMDRWGGMTQDIRARWAIHKGEFVYLVNAVAEEIASSKMTDEKRRSVVQSKLKLWKLYGDERF